MKALTYAAVGATRAADLMLNPPVGYRPLERTALLGLGDARFEYARAATMSWRIQEISGFRVERDATLVAMGEGALLVIPLGPFGVKAPARVVYLVDEPRRKGFAYGTLPGHPESGEELFVVEHRDDDSVWITIRAFSRPSRWYWWAAYPVLRLVQEYYTRRYLRALAGPLA